MSVIKNNLFQPGKPLYHKVRAGFVDQGISLNRWCKENGYRIENARSCLTGNWDGPKARQFRQEMVAAAVLDIELVEAS